MSTLLVLCEGLLSLRRAELSLNPNEVDKTRSQLERVVAQEPKWSVAWYALGRIRMAAAHADLVGREGALQNAGTPNSVGAAAAFERALSLDPGFTLAADLLAWSPVPFTDKNSLKARVQMLRKYRRALTPNALIGEAFLELDAGSADTAVMLLQTALKSSIEGTPRGFAQITMARAFYRINKPKEGRAALLAGAAESDSAGLAEYRAQVSWVGDSTEMHVWDTLPTNARPRWLQLFWSTRDIKEGRQDGDRLKEHYRRVNYAFSRYRLDLPFSGQQSAILSPGEAQMQRDLHNAADNARDKLHDEGLASEYRDYAAARVTLGVQSPFRVFKSQQTVLDDRGLIFIRHGKPEEMGERSVARADGSFQLFEIWRYHRQSPELPLTLYFLDIPFDGAVEANTLIPTLASEEPKARWILCALDASICPLTMDFGLAVARGEMSTMRVAESRRAGLEAIKDAVTSDNFPVVLARAMHPSIETHVLDQAQGGAPRLVVAFSLPGNELSRDTTKNGFQYEVLVTTMAVRTSDGKRVDISGSRHLTASHELRKGEYFSGLIELPMTPGKWLASAVITQADQRGARMTLSDIIVPEWSGNLSVSDLVLGRETSGVKWHSGQNGRDVPLNPLNAFPVGSSAELYAQISGLSPGTDYQVGIEIFEGPEIKGVPAISMQQPQFANASRAELRQTLGLANLKAGKYTVRVSVKLGTKMTTSTRGMEIR